MSQLRSLFKFWLILFGVGALVFFIFPERVLQSLNRTTEWISFLRKGAAEGSSLWLGLSVSLMATLTVLCYFIVENVSRARPLIIAVLTSKAVSTLAFLFFYLKNDHEAPMFWGVLCDGSIFGITYYFFSRANRSDR